MEKQKIFWVLMTLIISIVLLIVIINLVFKSDSVNEGKFRVSDAILTSYADVENTTEKGTFWTVDISQVNRLSLLISKATDAEISKIYIDGINSSKNGVIFSQNLGEEKIVASEAKEKLNIDYEVGENNDILIELLALNENILKDWQIPEDTKTIVYDGRIFKTAGMSLKDISFKLRFKLNIVEKNGKINTLKVELTLPKEEFYKNGADVRKLKLTDFKFKVN